MRAMGFCSFFPDDVRQLLLGGFEVFVNYSVFELAGVGQFLARGVHPAADDLVGVLAAAAHAALELLHRGGQDEDAHALRIDGAHLPRALPVDLQDQVVAARQRVGDHLLRRAVAVAVHVGVLEELAALLHGEESRVVDEVVVDAVLLAFPRRAGGIGDRELECRVVVHHRVDQRRLARPRRRGDDEEHAAHSMFCTCSRICSTSSLSSSAPSVTAWLAAFAATVFASRFSSCARKSSLFPTAPPCLRTRSTSVKCARSRVSSSSTSTFCANTATSVRMRSSSALPMASLSRSLIFSR